MILLLMACGGPAPLPVDSPQLQDSPPDSPADSPSDSPVDSPADSPPDDGFRGVVLDPPLSAPVFWLVNQNNESRDSSYFVGAPTVIWFFRDTANSCTNDGCGYRDLQADFDALGVRIVAIGPTTPAENLDWAQRLDYAYEIWSDPDGALPAAYGAESTFDEGALRHAFLLDADGLARLRFEGSVSLGADPLAVLDDARTLFGGE